MRRRLFIEPLESRQLLATFPIIVDNLDPINFTKSGAWNLATGTGYGYAGSIYWNNLPHEGSETASWTFNVEPGTYRVAGTWHGANPAHGSNVPVSVLNGTSQIGSVTLNQQIVPDDFFESGAWWENIGDFTVNSTVRIQLSDNANGYAVADAFRIERLPTTVAIVDNLDPINFSKSGAWNLATGTGYGYAGSIYWNNLPHEGSETASWTFNVEPGTYRVAGTWLGANAAHGSNVPVSVLNGTSQIGSVTLNQQIVPDDFFDSGAWWENIGTFTVGSTLRIQLSDNANGYAIADAFRIEKVATTVIVDNLDPINFAKTGAWNLASGAGIGYAGSIYWSNLPHDGSETASWTFNVDPGTYRVAGTWHGANPAHGSNVPISVLSGNTQIGVATLNQSLSPNDFFENSIWWENIGLFTVDSTLRIQLSDKANGYAIADAFRVERVMSASPVAQDDFAFFTPTGTDLVISTSSVPPPLLANDVALDSPTVWAKIATYPTNGTLIAFGINGTFTYRPNVGFTGVDSFTYRTSNGPIESLPARVSIAVGTRLLGRQNLDSNVFNPWSDDPWGATTLLDAATPSEGFGQGYSNIPMGSSGETEGGMAATGGLQLVEDVAPNTALVYRSNSLSKPIVSVHTQLAAGVAVPTAISARLIFNGVAGSFYSYSTANILAGQAMRFALQADGTSLQSGMYDYSIEVATTVNGVSLTQSFSGKQAIVNRSTSEFGFGWGLDGLDRLFDSTTGALIVRGNGDSLWFPKTGTSYQHALGDISYGTLVKNVNGTFTLTSKTGIVSAFSSLGLLTSRLDANSNAIAYGYTDSNSDGIAAELISITDPFGRITNFNYTSGKVTSISHFSGRTTALSYAGSNLTGYSLTDPDSAGPLTSPTINFGYALSNLASRTNALSEVTSFAFDSTDARLRSVLTPDNANWQIVPSETIGLPTGVSGNTLAQPINVQAIVTDQRNNAWKFRTDGFGGITESITALGFIRTGKRNADGLLYHSIEPDPDGSGPFLSPVTFVGYNASADLTYMVAPDGGVTRMDYLPSLHRLTSVVDPTGRSQNFFYSSTGNMLTSVDGAGFATSIAYNSRGLATSVTDPDPDGSGPLAAPVTGLAYDSFSRLTTVTNPDNSTQSFTYNSADQILTNVDELTKTTSFTYDSLGRTSSSTNRVNAVTQWVYDGMSRLTKQIDALGNPIDVGYNNRGWISAMTYPDPDGVGTLVRAVDNRIYDGVGNLKFHGDPDGGFQGQIEQKFDIDNRLEEIGSSVETGVFEKRLYDNIGRFIGINRVPSDSNGSSSTILPTFRTEVVYDDFGRMTQRITRLITGGVATLFSEFFTYNKAGELVSRTDGRGNTSSNTYDGRGLLVRETMPDADGNGPQFPLVVTHGFDNMGREIRTDHGFGRVTNVEYNSRSWPTNIIQSDPDGTGPATSPTTIIGYNLRGDQTSITDPLSRVTSYAFDNEQRVTGRTDPDPDGAGPLAAPVKSWVYNANDWITSFTDPVGATTSILYDALGPMVTQTDPDPDGVGLLTSPVTQYAYSMRGLESVTDPMSHVTSYFRDNRGRLESMTDTAGFSANYKYDFYDNLIKRTDPDADGSGPLAGLVTNFQYDAHDRLLSQSDPLTGSTSYQYDTASNLTNLTDPNGNVTSFGYDNWNRKVLETNALSLSRSYTYDVAGNLTRTTDRNGRVIQYVYDALDRLTAEKWQPTGGTTSTPTLTVSTVQDGALINEQQSLGWSASNATSMSGAFTISYVGQTTSALPWNSSAATIQAALEAIPAVGTGNVAVTVSAPTTFSRTILLTFQNAKGGQNLAQATISTTGIVVGPLGTLSNFAQTTVNGASIPEKQSLAFSGSGATGSDAGSWRVAYNGEVSGPLSPSISITDLELVLESFVGIDNVSVISIGGIFQVTFGGTQATTNMQQIFGDASNVTNGFPVRTITTSYNAASEIVSVTDPSLTIDFTRDNLGRATTIANTSSGYYPSATFSQAFDAVGNRTELRATTGAPDFKNTYTYDKLRRMTDIVQTGQAGGYPVASKHVTQTFNALSQKTNISRYQSTGNSNAVASTDFTYDSANRLSGIAHKQGTTNLNTYTYSYDPLSRLTSVTSTAEGATNYSYNATSQLVGANNTGAANETYGYDANGNRNTTGYATGSDNRTTTDATYTYYYDAEGNRTGRTNASTLKSTSYTWDYRNRLAKVVNNEGAQLVQVDYKYDAFNRLIWSLTSTGSQGGMQQYWYYDEGINPVLHRDSSNSNFDVTHRYLWSDNVDELLSDEQTTSLSSSGNTLWGLADHLGTIRDIADLNEGSGVTSVTNHRRYNAFGKRISETNTAVDVIFGYTGKQFDEATGLQHNLNRWYDPNLGKWISQDPIGFAAGDANLYRYVGNSPTNATDPSGLQEVGSGLPSEFPIDFSDQSANDRSSLRWKLFWEGFSRSSRYETWRFGCGDLAAKRLGLLEPGWEHIGRRPFPGSVEGVHYFSNLDGALEVADSLVKNGTRLRLILLQTNGGPAGEIDVDAVPKGKYAENGEVDPSRIGVGVYNFATIHWDGCKYYFEYVADGRTDKYRKVSPGNLPFGSYPHVYYGVVIITPEMEKNAIGLPRVPWKE